MSGSNQPITLEEFIASLAKGHGDLGVRIRTATHSAKSKNSRVTLHAHYPAFREGKPTIGELVDMLNLKLVPFCLSRKHIRQAQQEWNTLPHSKIQERAVRLHQQALDLFKRANKSTNRNGEFGELIVYLLIEAILEAPQFVAKMSLKTNSQMPVHGSDGIHIRYDSSSGKLSLYWGESKCYSAVRTAIQRAVQSVAENLEHEKMSHELFLVEQYFDLSDFPDEFREPILSFLDPYHNNYNKRTDVSVILVAFDFAAFSAVSGLDPDKAEGQFLVQLNIALQQCAGWLDAALARRKVKNHTIEVFFLPVPSVDELRTLFQDRIGWTT